MGDASHLVAGQRWKFDASHGFDDAHLTIGAIVSPGDTERIVCFSVSRAPTTVDGGVQTEAMISFIPMAESAFLQTITTQDGTGSPPAEFMDELEAWRTDPRGLMVFTVSFDGCLDRLLARQAATLIKKPAA